MALGRRRLVLRRRAAHGGEHVGAAQLEAVVDGDAGGLVGQPGPPQGREEPVAGAVAGEDPSRPVAAVGGGGQTDDGHPGPRIAEAGDGPTPVLLVGEGGPPFGAPPARATPPGGGSAGSV